MRSFSMTWQAATRRWLKKRDGRQHVVSCRQLRKLYPELVEADTKEGSRVAANQWWADTCLGLDGEAAKQARQDRLAAMFHSFAADEGFTGSDAAADILRQLIERPSGNLSVTAQGVKQLAQVSAAATRMRPHEESATCTTLVDCIEAFLDAKQIDAKGGQISAGRWDNLTKHLDHLRRWASRSGVGDLMAFDASALDSFRSYLLDLMGEGSISSTYAADVLATLKQLLRWASRRRGYKLPDNLDDAKIIRRPKAPKPATDTQVAAALAVTDPRAKLYVLLALHGLTEKDMADLTEVEVDLEAGVIDRRRSKTRDHSGVPCVARTLWPECAELLRSEASGTTPVLLTQSGGPVWQDRIIEGKRRKSCAVRMTLRNKGVTVSCQTLKKAAASALRNSEYADCVDLFLGHAPRKLSDRHYAAVPQQRFDAALAWLRGQFLG